MPADNPGVQVLTFGTTLTPRAREWMHDHLRVGTLVRVRPIALARQTYMEERLGVASDVLFGQMHARTCTVCDANGEV